MPWPSASSSSGLVVRTEFFLQDGCKPVALNVDIQGHYYSGFMAILNHHVA